MEKETLCAQRNHLKEKKSDYSSFIFVDEEGFYCIEPIYISRSVH